MIIYWKKEILWNYQKTISNYVGSEREASFFLIKSVSGRNATKTFFMFKYIWVLITAIARLLSDVRRRAFSTN